MDSPITTLDAAVEWLYALNVGVVGKGAARHERPHKPVMLLAVLDLIAGGRASPERIEWSQVLRARFAEYFRVVATSSDDCSPELPFRYLNSDSHWSATVSGPTGSVPLEHAPKVSDCDRGRIVAALIHGLDRFVVSVEDRTRLRLALVERYFPSHRNELVAMFSEESGPKLVAEINSDATADEPARPGRSGAFRKKILELYDFQCAACGLRIRMPEVADLTFVDAAHLIPFAEAFNDHPTNGLALCKNHHWAMDSRLIAPAPDGRWRASNRLLAHRSLGERDLVALHERPVLHPVDDAYRPAPSALAWRVERLLA